ncbi:MAG: DNA-binding protein [Alphaproteobacteria bacterium]|nr:DNA-binding protein [Alphaproteobacteria bacterium]
MALFFDAAWFNAQLAAGGLTAHDLARHLALSPEEVALMWKDQREVSASEVLAMARLFNATPEEVARRAGVSTPIPKTGGEANAQILAALSAIEGRLQRLERGLADLKAMIAAGWRKE